METARIAFDLYVTSERLLRSLGKRQPPGTLTRQRLSTLLTLAKSGEGSVKDLARAELVAHSTMSRLVSSLDVAGLATTAERRGRARDGRTRTVRLTEKGKRTADRAVRCLTAELEGHLARLVEADIVVLQRAIGILHDIAASLCDRPEK